MRWPLNSMSSSTQKNDDELHDVITKPIQWVIGGIETPPDKLKAMAPELREYATRQTQRINEAHQKLKSTTVQNRGR